MTSKFALIQMYRGCYHWLNEQEAEMYIGSTYFGLRKLEENHRLWKIKGYDRTDFRHALITIGQNWRVKWLIKPAPRNQIEIELIESELIRSHTPKYNRDMDPVASSIKYGRYTYADYEQIKARQNV